MVLKVQYCTLTVYEQYRSIEPWLQTKDGKAEGQAEFLQTREDRAKLDGMVSQCIQADYIFVYYDSYLLI